MDAVHQHVPSSRGATAHTWQVTTAGPAGGSYSGPDAGVTSAALPVERGSNGAYPDLMQQGPRKMDALPSRHRRHASDTFAGVASQLLAGGGLDSSLNAGLVSYCGPEATQGKPELYCRRGDSPAAIVEEPLLEALHSGRVNGNLLDVFCQDLGGDGMYMVPGGEHDSTMGMEDDDLFASTSPRGEEGGPGDSLGRHYRMPSISGSSAASLQHSALAACSGRSITTLACNQVSKSCTAASCPARVLGYCTALPAVECVLGAGQPLPKQPLPNQR